MYINLKHCDGKEILLNSDKIEMIDYSKMAQNILTITINNVDHVIYFKTDISVKEFLLLLTGGIASGRRFL